MDKHVLARPGEQAHWARYSILVVDDEPGMVSFLQRALSARSAQVDTAGSVEEAVPLLARHLYDLIILDIALPGVNGVEWLHQLRDGGYGGDVILVTAYADLDTAIDALRAGASDFLLKPFSVAQMLNAIERCFERSSLRRENYLLKRQVEEHAVFVDGFVCQTERMHNVCARIKRIAPSQATVLLTGESGTGKEVAARALHRMSTRADGPFVPINCASIAAELIESELFGHVKGAFTGALGHREGLFYYARGGTLFLDEIGELPLAAQAKLLRVMEERRIRPVGSEQEIPVDVRVIAATNRDLVEEVAARRFRQDLYYRLQVVELHLPPLRERLDDLPLLARHFMALIAAELGVAPLELDAATLAHMAAHDWPGNVRELRNFIERSLILGWFDLGDAHAGGDSDGDEACAAAPGTLAVVEKQHILTMLAACNGNKSEAARRLGVSRKTLERKCAAWGV